MAASGTVAITRAREDIGSLNRKKIVVAWTSDAAAGTVSQVIAECIGAIERVVTDPGTPAPTANYDITLLDENGIDVLQNLGQNRHTSNSEQIFPGGSCTDGTNNTVIPMAVHGDLTLTIANAGNSKQGTFTLYLRT